MLSSWHTFLEAQGAHFENGQVQHFGDAAGEIQHMGCILADLSHLSLIQFSGEDAQTFLQGQLTNDVRQLNGQNVQLSGYCTPKGRLLASLQLWQSATNTYVAQLPASLRETIQKRLTMYVLRAKLKVSDISDQNIRLGVGGQEAADLIGQVLGPVPAADFAYAQYDQGAILRLPGSHFELLLAPEQAQPLWLSLNKTCRSVGVARWNSVLIRAGIPTILPDTQEEFIPQMLNFDLIGAVNFKKGCYPGQEIVARTQYLGKLKRRMYLGKLPADSTPQPGDALYSDDMPDQATGVIVNVAPAADGGYDVLAALQIASVEQHAMHWKSASGPQFTLQTLPYELNTDN